MLIHNARVVLPDDTALDAGWLQWDADNGRIVALGAGAPPPDADTIDAGGRWLVPGFVDVHVHGAVGVDTMDADADALRRMAGFYAQHGVTTFLPTTWADTDARIRAALSVIGGMVGPVPGGASIAGAHLEGPYLNPARSGAQNSASIRRAGREEAQAYLDASVIRLVALAPEYEENHWLVRACVARGVTVAAAHTDATYEQMVHAVALGVRQATHTGNAMSALHHRAPGAFGAALTLPDVRCEVIADFVHLHPAVVRLVWLAKGADGVILISDAIRAAGMTDGDYPVDDRVMHVRDGVARLADGTLAGSTLTMDVGLANLMRATGAPLTQAWRAASLTPARAVGLAAQTGQLAVGLAADLALLDVAPDATVTVVLTVARGRVVYNAPSSA